MTGWFCSCFLRLLAAFFSQFSRAGLAAMFVCAVRPIFMSSGGFMRPPWKTAERGALTSLDARGAAACSAADKLRAVAGDALALPKEQGGPAKTDLCRSLCASILPVAMCLLSALLRYSANSQIPPQRPRKHDGSRPSTRLQVE